MRIHLLSVPNTVPTAAYELDGFCLRTRLFAALLRRLGHTVMLYGVDQTDVADVEFVRCVTADEHAAFLGPVPYQNVPFEEGSLLFKTFNTRAAHAIRERKQAGDLVATIAGWAQRSVAEHHPELPFLEYSIGYPGVIAPFRIFQSHAWRHVVHGHAGIDTGRAFDAVIPPWFDEATFPVATAPDPYVIYCGRVVESKGIAIACRAAEAARVPLVVIGHGDPRLVTYGTFVGAVSTVERNALLSKARACLMPTQYLEPFGNVAAEAQLCGTPVLSTDWGGFTESVDHGRSGYRCATVGEFAQAIDRAGHLDRGAIRRRAVRLYGMESAIENYQAYFQRFDQIHRGGLHSLAPTLQESCVWAS